MQTALPSEVLGQFSILGRDEKSWAGVLTFGTRPALRILVTSNDSGGFLPTPLQSLQQGAQLDFVGATNTLGCITLSKCAYSSGRGYGSHAPELTLHPTEIWAGPQPFSEDANYSGTTLGFSGIHSIIGNNILGHKILVDAAQKLAIETILGVTQEVFYRNPLAVEHKIELLNQRVTVLFYSSYSASFSAYKGDEISTYDECRITSSNSSSGKQLVALASNIEHFLSFICLKSIRCNELTLEKTDADLTPSENYKRLWYLGSEPSNEGVMFHEALGTFSKDPIPMEAALNAWFSSSDDEKLARWLFLDSQDQNVITAGRFIAVCQAVEIIGGQARSGGPRFDKSKFSQASLLGAETICRELGAEYQTPEYKDRFRQLIATGNRFSFRDKIITFMSAIPPMIKETFLQDQEQFINILVKMRNLFVHMANNNLSFDEGDSKLTAMTYKLLVLFAAHQAVALGMSPDRVLQGLRNSSLGRSAAFLRTP